MTFSEKNILGTLASFMLITIYYALSLLGLYRGGGLEQPALIRLWIVVIVLSIIASIVFTILSHIILAVVNAVLTGEKPDTREIKDERDRLIDLRGTHLTHNVASIGTFLAMLTFALGKPAVIMFSLLVLVGLLAQVAGDAWRMFLYRRAV